MTRMAELGDIGDFGFADDDDFGKGGAADATPVKQTRKASQRNALYAKSPQQRMQQEQDEREYQEALRESQAALLEETAGGFGDGGDGGDGASPSPPGGGGFQIWGQAQASGGARSVVIPPFVPRDQRKSATWNVGKMTKRDADKAVLGSSQGSFLIREMQKGGKFVVAVHDNKTVFEAYIRCIDGGRFNFQSREFNDLEEIVKHLQRNCLYNRSGLPLYIDKPVRV